MTDPTTDNPGVIVFPPFLFGGALLAALLLHWLAPWHAPLPFAARMAGMLLITAAGASLGIWAEVTMHRAGTNVHPGKPSTALVTSGPFAYVRNPLYLFLSSIYFGVGIAVGSFWWLVVALPMFLVLDYGIVRREERYLEAKFGQPYRTYKTRVRRWLPGPPVRG